MISMCYYYSIGDIIELSKWYGRSLGGIGQQLTLFDSKVKNGFSHPMMPVITPENLENFSVMSWGLIPSWARKDIETLRKNTLNARGETVFEKPSFKGPILRKRCLVPASYFVEWQHNEKEKIPYRIFLKERPFFSFGGIYDLWTNHETGEVIESFSIITTEANPLMAEIHNTKKRMPLILSLESEKLWLSNIPRDIISGMIVPYDEKEMTAEKVDY
jgi:putative SOS response-associated peptidase YedK